MIQFKAVDIQVSGNFRLRWDSGQYMIQFKAVDIQVSGNFRLRWDSGQYMIQFKAVDIQVSGNFRLRWDSGQYMIQFKAVDIQVSGNFRLRWDSSLKIWDLYPDIDDGVLDTTLCDKVGQWLVTGQWFSPGTPVSFTNKTDHHDITEILLKVALNTLTLTPILMTVSLFIFDYTGVPSYTNVFVTRKWKGNCQVYGSVVKG